MRKNFLFFIALLLIVFVASSCRKDVEVFINEDTSLSDPSENGFSGFYLLNEGNMGSNKSTLDYFDFTSGKYQRNIYAAINPNVPKELGDVGNAIAIYGERLYAVINAS